MGESEKRQHKVIGVVFASILFIVGIGIGIVMGIFYGETQIRGKLLEPKKGVAYELVLAAKKKDSNKGKFVDFERRFPRIEQFKREFDMSERVFILDNTEKFEEYVKRK